MTKVLIIGAAGFMGSNLSNWFMCHTNYDIVGIDDCSKHSNLLTLQPNLKSKRYNLQISDVLNEKTFNKILKFENPDYIILTTNYETTKNALSIIDIKCENLKKIIVLLDRRWQSIPKTNLPLVGLFAPNLFGSRQNPNSFIPAVIKAALYKTDLEVDLSPGGNGTDWLYAKDAYRAIECLMVDGKIDSNYMISADQKFTDEQLMGKIFHIIGYVPKVRSNYCLAEDVGHEFKSIDGWKQEFTIDSALEHTVCWYDTNRWIFKEI